MNWRKFMGWPPHISSVCSSVQLYSNTPVSPHGGILEASSYWYYLSFCPMCLLRTKASSSLSTFHPLVIEASSQLPFQVALVYTTSMTPEPKAGTSQLWHVWNKLNILLQEDILKELVLMDGRTYVAEKKQLSSFRSSTRSGNTNNLSGRPSTTSSQVRHTSLG